jgi:23S rRNA pseudouridine1911/1915/1917 synthase
VRSSETVVGDERFAGARLDSYLATGLGLFPRSQARSRVDVITVNGRPAKLATRLCRDDRVAVTYRDPEPLTAVAEEMDLSILHEDADAIVLDKPAGIVTHPGAGNRTGTLLNGVLGHCGRVRDSFPDEPVRPGVVHRLDKETSGVIVFAKSAHAHRALTRQFALRRVRKRYLAVLDGRPPAADGTVDLPIGRDDRDRTRFAVVARGRPAITRYRLLGGLEGGCSLVLLIPVTGRTHQLRVHLASLGCPVAGDVVYGRSRRSEPASMLLHGSMLLHSASLRLRLPGAEEPRRFRAPLPERFRAKPGVVDCLRTVSPAGAR